MWLARHMVDGRGVYDGTKKGGLFLSVHNTYIHQAKEKKEQTIPDLVYAAHESKTDDY